MRTEREGRREREGVGFTNKHSRAGATIAKFTASSQVPTRFASKSHVDWLRFTLLVGRANACWGKCSDLRRQRTGVDGAFSCEIRRSWVQWSYRRLYSTGRGLTTSSHARDRHRLSSAFWRAITSTICEDSFAFCERIGGIRGSQRR